MDAEPTQGPGGYGWGGPWGHGGRGGHKDRRAVEPKVTATVVRGAVLRMRV